MIRAISRAVALAACVAVARSAAAQEPVEPPQSLYPFQTLVCPDDLLRACCPIYCRKPQPCIPCFVNGCGVAYCPKPLPCIPCFVGGCSADCYCPKPCPNLCRPIAADYYRCVEKGAECAGPAACDADLSYPAAEVYAAENDLQAN
jgi:hypothetical protein